MSFQVILTETAEMRVPLFPLVATRPIGNLRLGILTIDEKWAKILNTEIFFETDPSLQEKFDAHNAGGNNVLYIQANLLPNEDLVKSIRALRIGQTLVGHQGECLAFFAPDKVLNPDVKGGGDQHIVVDYAYSRIEHLEDIFKFNAEQIQFDLSFCVDASLGKNFHASNCIIGDECYIHQSVDLMNVTLDSSLGPIYIADGAVVEPGAVIKGPVAICKGSRVKAGAILYPNVTVGNNSTVGGELNNVVIWGGSAKGHDGYLGYAVLGEGVNLGAGTTNSNLKNNWSTVKVYDYSIQGFRDTDLLKCGVFLGDYVMLGIHTKINTGTVIGVGSQLAISGFVPKFVPDFIWMTDTKCESYIFESFLKMMSQRACAKGEELTGWDVVLLEHVYQKTDCSRNTFYSTLNKK